MSATAYLRSRTTSPSSKLSSSIPTASGRELSPQKYRRASKSVSPEPRTFSPTTTDMNRVHEELEKLNIATDVINKLELQLDQARETFREIQSSWTQKMEQLSKKLGTCIDKSRPFYEAKMKLFEAQQDAQRAALRFERANSLHAVAKQQVSLTQDSLHRQQPGEVDPACLEVLNHHIQRVNEAERERLQSEDEHKRVSCRVEEANRRVLWLQKELKGSIKKSKPYFDARLEFMKVLDDQKMLIQRLEAEIKQKKQDYNTSLRNLERISDEIHERRQSLGRRDPGVGCETPDPPPMRKESNEGVLESESNGKSISNQKQKQSVVHLRRKSKTSTKVDQLMEILGAKAIIVAADDDRPRAESMPAELLDESGRARLNSGIILLAQQLLSNTGNKKLEPTLNGDRKTRAFTFPPEQLDLQYKTVPEGVKPFPTPPETPASPPTLNVASLANQPASDKNLVRKQSSCDGFTSETSSVSSFAFDDDQIERIVMRSPVGLMKEIEKVFDRAQNSAEHSEEDSGCSIRISQATTASSAMTDRGSVSGAEDS